MRVPRLLPVSLVVAVLAATALLASGCGRNVTAVARTVNAKPSGASATPSAPPTRPVTVPASLTFTGTTLDGKAFDAATLAGRPVILWFWAPWCATCLGQGASVSDVAARYSGRVSLLGVAGLDQSTKAMNDFVTQAEVGTVPHLNDKAGVLWKRFGIKEQSTFVMINRSGAVMLTGYMDSVTLDEWAAYLDKH
jgi:thiol-disulfide isomerase/thioredoxin